MSCGVGRRGSLDLVWLWLWSRPVATAPNEPLAWEPPYAEGAALEVAKKKLWSSHCGSVVMSPTSIYEDVGLIPGLVQWIKDPMLPRAVV